MNHDSDMFNSKRGRRLLINLIILAIGGAYLFYAYYIYVPNKLKDDFVMTTGTMVRLDNSTGEGQDVFMKAKLHYTVDGKSFTLQEARTQPCNYEADLDSEDFWNFRYPVIYSPDNPGAAELLITPERFREYGLEFPDSLQNIYQRFFKCG